jgi:hypothetical protein
MMKAKVWDIANATEDNAAWSYVAISPLADLGEVAVDLAERYADQDVGGNSDGIYNNGHDIAVSFDNGRSFRVTVNVDWSHGRFPVEPLGFEGHAVPAAGVELA